MRTAAASFLIFFAVLVAGVAGPASAGQRSRTDFDQGTDVSWILEKAGQLSESESQGQQRDIDSEMASPFGFSIRTGAGSARLGAAFWPPSDNPTQPCVDNPPSLDDSGGVIRNRCATASLTRTNSEARSIPAPASILGPFADLVTENPDYQEGSRLKQHLDTACGIGVLAIPPTQCAALAQTWSGLQATRGDLITQGKDLDSYDGNLESNVPRLNSWLQKIQTRRSDIEVLRGKHEAGCKTCRTKPECDACNEWARKANTCITAHNTSATQRRQQYDAWKAAHACLKPQGDDFRSSVANWINGIKSWIQEARKAVESTCRPVDYIEVYPPSEEVPTGGLERQFEAKTVFKMEPSGAPPCPIDIFWVLDPRPEDPSKSIGDISPRMGSKTTTFRSGNGAGIGTIACWDQVSGIAAKNKAVIKVDGASGTTPKR